MKALKINVETQTIEEVLLTENFEDISKEIGNGCNYFCCPYVFPNSDTIYADDESLLRQDNIVGGFMLEGWQTMIVGNAIILGTDDEGGSIDYKTDKDNLYKKISFVEKSLCLKYAKEVMSYKPMFKII